LGVPTLATRLKGNGLIADLDLRARWSDLWAGGSVGAALQLFALPLLYWPILKLLDKHPSDLGGPAKDLTDRATGHLRAVLLLLVGGGGAPIMEEISCGGRGRRPRLRRGAPPPVAIGVTAVIFGISHGELLQLPALVLFGAVAGYLSYRSGRLGPGIAAHV